ncbi:OsmC family protein [Halodesulfovibrio aestuarii]|uniref:OsmC family protein n=1 Tax=Halodesulfovibrio aestuarii TaxID=126333 RepID=A0A8G2CAS8_9BACT|nr:OsmC family protein [Halodesulfovibrio aestuarii]SHJ24965.1 osmotically inducible protein OsmC [Halodesulfovibrio aestuarii]
MAELTVSYDREGEKQTIHTGSKVLGDIDINYEGVPADQRGGTAKQLLASSALYCFCGALGKALETRGATYERITGTATLETGVDEKKRARVTGITLDVTVHMDEDYDFIFDRVEKIMKQGCLVTASLHAAFPMTYNLHHEC